MNLRSRQDITKSNGFSFPLSRVCRHPHIEVLRLAYAAPSPHLANDFQLDQGAERSFKNRAWSCRLPHPHRISRRRLGIAELLRQVAARGLEVGPFIFIMEWP